MYSAIQRAVSLGWHIVSDIAIFVLKRDVKLQLTNLGWHSQESNVLPFHMNLTASVNVKTEKRKVFSHAGNHQTNASDHTQTVSGNKFQAIVLDTEKAYVRNTLQVLLTGNVVTRP